MNFENEIKELKKRVELLEKALMTKILKKNTNKEQIAKRDKTKYMYNGKIYAKNRLVLAVIKDYTAKHKCSFDELRKAFDKSLQGSRNVVEKLSNVQKMSDGAKRYFLKDADIIELKDSTKVVVCTQWGIFNIKKFIFYATSLGFCIEIINN